MELFLMSPPSIPALQRLHCLDRAVSAFQDQLSDVLYGEEYQKCAPNLQGDDLVWLVDYLDKALGFLDPSGPAFRKCLRELRSICGAGGILPTSYTLLTHLLNIDPNPFAWGGYGDVFKGTLDGSRVCIKRVRVYTDDDPKKAAKIFCQEAVMWKYLTHPNILPLLGVTITPFQLVSSWMPGGDLPEYIKKNPGASRRRLLSDVAKGLCYLHSCNVIHGDLKGANILVDNSGSARVADFGLAMVTHNLDSTRGTSCQRGHTARWAAPEVLSEGSFSKGTDIFSFAMVMTEVFTGVIPFSGDSSFMAILAITQGKRPARPTHPTFTENLWTLMQRCWDHRPHLRPEVSEVLDVLLTPEHIAWERLIRQPLAMYERTSLITTIFLDRNQVEMVEHLSGDDAQTFIDTVDKALDGLAPQIRRECLRSLYKICGRQALLPRSLGIPLCYDPTATPLRRGGFADVWRGRHHGQEVAAKALRVRSTDDFERIRKGFCREVMAWGALHHPNVLPLLGVTMSENQLVMVSEWMVKGNINEFVRADPNADRLELLEDAIRGLIYMHDQGITHGNLKGANVLITNYGHACISDFNLITVISDPKSFIPSCIEGDMAPWTSPELLDPEKFGLKESRPTDASDCYALGMVIYEVVSGQKPFASLEGLAVIRKVLYGKRPGRPRGEGGKLFTDGIWRILELCWKRRPGDRISAKTVLRGLEEDSFSSWPSSDMDGIVEMGSGDHDRSDDTASDSCPSTPRGGEDSLVLPQNPPLGETSVLSPSAPHNGNKHQIPPLGCPPGVTSPVVPPAPDDGERPIPQQRGSSNLGQGWVGWLARNAWEMFKAIT